MSGNPNDKYLRLDRMPHMWCPGCGVGTSVNFFTRALEKSKLDLKKVVVVSGIGCTGRVAGYINLDSFHTTHGRAIPFATGLKLANPELTVVVYSGDGDIAAIGGNHLINAARRNIDINVICVNNFNYAMTGGQFAPTTPTNAIAATSPYGNIEDPFNLPFLAESSGSTYVARWTTFHARQAVKSIANALVKPGFSFIEIIASCPTLYSRRNRLGDGLDAMKYYRDSSEIQNGANTKDVAIQFQDKIICGVFVDEERPSFLGRYNEHLKHSLGANFKEYKGVVADEN